MTPKTRDQLQEDDGERFDARDGERWRVRFIGLALAMLCLGLFVGKTAWDGTSALAEGDAAARRGEDEGAIAAWTAAARAYLPGAAYAGMAHQRLLELGDEAAERGELERADRAYAAVCEAIADTAWAITPYAEELARAEAGRGALRRGAGGASSATAAPSDRAATAKGKRAAKRHRARAASSGASAASGAAALAPAAPLGPRLAAAMHARTWAGVAFLGLVGVALALGLLRRGGASDDRSRGARDLALRTRWAAIVLAASAALFTLGIYQL